MKGVLSFMLATTLLRTQAQGQNGGQSTESASLKLELAGTTNYRAVIKATNKQNCFVNVKFDHNGQTIIKPIPPFGSDTIHITLPECIIKAKPMTNCGNNADMGWVELNVCVALPIKFEWIKTRQIDTHTVELQFKPSEVDGKEFYIQLSEDGINFKRVLVVLPTDIKVGQIYSVKVKI